MTELLETDLDGMVVDLEGKPIKRMAEQYACTRSDAMRLLVLKAAEGCLTDTIVKALGTDPLQLTFLELTMAGGRNGQGGALKAIANAVNSHLLVPHIWSGGQLSGPMVQRILVDGLASCPPPGCPPPAAVKTTTSRRPTSRLSRTPPRWRRHGRRWATASSSSARPFKARRRPTARRRRSRSWTTRRARPPLCKGAEAKARAAAPAFMPRMRTRTRTRPKRTSQRDSPRRQRRRKRARARRRRSGAATRPRAPPTRGSCPW